MLKKKLKCPFYRLKIRMHYQNKRIQQRTTPFTPEIKALFAKIPKVHLNKSREVCIQPLFSTESV